MVAALLDKFTKNHCVVKLKWVDFMICKILLHKVVKNRFLHRVVEKRTGDGTHVVPGSVPGVARCFMQLGSAIFHLQSSDSGQCQ